MPPATTKTLSTQSTKSKVQLHLHECALELHHAKAFFADDPTLEAVYVIAPTESAGQRLHYIHSTTRTINLISMTDSVESLVDSLNCVANYEERKNCLIPVVSRAHLRTITAKTHHVHQRDYVLNLVKALGELNQINDFDEKDYFIYQEVMQAYENFMYDYCADVFKELDIILDKDFYTYNLMTQAKPPEPLEKFLATYTNDSSDQISQKLNGGKSKIKPLLSLENANLIIAGIYKLEWLLSLAKPEPIWSENFNSTLHTGTNLIIDFLLNNTAESHGLDQEAIKNKLSLKATGKQQELINILMIECKQYLSYLDLKLATAAAADETTPLLSRQKKLEKRANIHSLITILNDDTVGASTKIETFRNEFESVKPTLKQHTDGRSLLFIKRVAYVLSSFFLGAGLIYSYATNGTCNFFKSKGEVLTDKLSTHFMNPQIHAT